jgi:PAS domain S-box-containing protein
MQITNQDNMDSKQGIDAIFQFATEGILLTNEKSEILHINPSAEKLFGYNEGELVGEKIEILIPKRFAHKHVAHRDGFIKNPQARKMGSGMDLVGMKKDGSEFPVEVSLSPFTSDEGKFVVAFVSDVTLRKLTEENLKNYSEELEKQVADRTVILQEVIVELEKTKNEVHQALQKEIEVNEMKSRFVSMASHEFRTPLATILSSLALVKKYGDQNDTENQFKHIQKIKSSISHLTDILNDFLSVSKLEEGKVKNNVERFNIKGFIEEVISDMESLCKWGQVIHYGHKGDEFILLDKKLMRHILFNLISNSVKFSDENTAIKIVTENLTNEFKLSIEDQGIGISEKDQVNLFERFFRARNALNVAGTGLGLNIIKNYIELMNGSISFKSVENKGTTFYLNFPQ